jgi:hypothetical protein
MFGAIIAACALFASALGREVIFHNNCPYDTVAFQYTKTNELYASSSFGPLVLPRGIYQFDTNITTLDVTHIQFIDPTISQFYDQYGNEHEFEDVLCDDVEGTTACPDLKIPTMKLLPLEGIDAVFMCSMKSHDADIRVVNNCPDTFVMYVFQDNGDGTNYALDTNESDWNVQYNSIVFVEKHKNVLLNFVSSPDFWNNGINTGFEYNVTYFDQNKNQIELRDYVCGNISKECGDYANTTAQLIDATAIDTLYMCSAA